MTKIFHHKKILNIEKDVKYNEALNKLVNKSYDSDDLEIIDGKFFSFRVNKRKRLFFIVAKYQEENAIVVLEYNQKHKYDRSHIRKPGVFDNLVSQDIPHGHLVPNPKYFSLYKDITPATQNNKEARQEVTLKFPLYHERFKLTLDEEQQNGLQTRMPALVVAPPGAGKTLLAMDLISKELTDPYDPSCISLPIWCVTRSKFLSARQQEAWQQLHHLYGYPVNAVRFLMINEVLLEAKIVTRLEDIANEDTFNAWFKKWLPHYKDLQKTPDNFIVPSVFEHQERIYQELRLRAGYSKAVYEKLGQRQSLFKPEERVFIDKIYQDYLEYLQTEKRVDPDLLFIEIQERLSRLIIFDEGQDGSPTILGLLQQLTANQRFVVNFGEGQSLNNHLPLLDYYSAKIPYMISLSHIYRCPQNIFPVIKTYADYKKRLARGNISKLNQEFKLAPQQKKAGNVVFITKKEQLEPIIEHHLNDASFFVLTHEEYLPELKDFLPQRVMRASIASFKGDEGSTIVLYNILKPDIYAKANAELYHAEDVSTYRGARQLNYDFEQALCTLIAAVSRSNNELIFLENSYNKHKLNRFYQPIEEIIAKQTPVTIKEAPVTSSVVEWQQRYEHFRQMGDQVEAERVYEHRLKTAVVTIPQPIRVSKPASTKQCTNNQFKPDKETLQLVQNLLDDVSVANYKALLEHPDAARLLLEKIVVSRRKAWYLQRELANKKFTWVVLKDKDIAKQIKEILLQAFTLPRSDTEVSLFFLIVQTDLLVAHFLSLIQRKPEICQKITLDDLIKKEFGNCSLKYILEHDDFKNKSKIIVDLILQNNLALKEKLIKTEQFKKLTRTYQRPIRTIFAVKSAVDNILGPIPDDKRLQPLVLPARDAAAQLKGKKSPLRTLTTIIDASAGDSFSLIKKVIVERDILAFKQLLTAPNAAYLFFECQLTQYINYQDEPFYTSLFIYLMADKMARAIGRVIKEETSNNLFMAMVTAAFTKQLDGSSNKILKSTFPFLFSVFSKNSKTLVVLQQVLIENPKLQNLLTAEILCKNHPVNSVFLNAPSVSFMCAFIWVIISSSPSFELIDMCRAKDEEAFKAAIYSIPVTYFIRPILDSLTVWHLLLKQENYASGKCWEIMEWLLNYHPLLASVMTPHLLATVPTFNEGGKTYKCFSILSGLYGAGEKGRQILTLLGKKNIVLLPLIEGAVNAVTLATPQTTTLTEKSAKYQQEVDEENDSNEVTTYPTNHQKLIADILSYESGGAADLGLLTALKKSREILFETPIDEYMKDKQVQSTLLIFMLLTNKNLGAQFDVLLKNNAGFQRELTKILVSILKKDPKEIVSEPLKRLFPYIISLFSGNQMIEILDKILTEDPDLAKALEFKHLFNQFDLSVLSRGSRDVFWQFFELLKSVNGVGVLHKLRVLRPVDFDAFITSELLCESSGNTSSNPLLEMSQSVEGHSLLSDILKAKGSSFIGNIPFEQLTLSHVDNQPTILHLLLKTLCGVEIFEFLIKHHPKVAQLSREFLMEMPMITLQKKQPERSPSIIGFLESWGYIGQEIFTLMLEKVPHLREEFNQSGELNNLSNLKKCLENKTISPLRTLSMFPTEDANTETENKDSKCSV